MAVYMMSVFVGDHKIEDRAEERRLKRTVLDLPSII